MCVCVRVCIVYTLKSFSPFNDQVIEKFSFRVEKLGVGEVAAKAKMAANAKFSRRSSLFVPSLQVVVMPQKRTDGEKFKKNPGNSN